MARESGPCARRAWRRSAFGADLGGITAATAVFSDDAPPPNLNDVVDRISPRPVFFIYAEQGQGGEELSQDYYESAKEPKAVWKVPGATTPAASRPGRASTSAG